MRYISNIRIKSILLECNVIQKYRSVHCVKQLHNKHGGPCVEFGKLGIFYTSLFMLFDLMKS